MISFRETGTHRLVYKAEAFGTGLTVTAYIWNPSLVKSGLQTFTEVADGLYYLDYNFATTGAYIGLFMEGGTKKTASAIRVETPILEQVGVTVGGTWTTAKLLQVMAAWMMGKWQDKSGVAGTYEVLDPDDETTVVVEVVPQASTPQKTVTILI